MERRSIGAIIGMAWGEAFSRGLDLKAPETLDAVTEIAMEMVERDFQERMAAERAERERSQPPRSPDMDDEKWARAMWPDGRAMFYRKDFGTPPEVAEALAKGEARLIERKGTGGDSAEQKRKPAKCRKRKNTGR